MVLEASLHNTQQYKVCIKGKVELSRERSSGLPLHLGVVAIEKGAFWSPLTTVTNFTFTYIASGKKRIKKITINSFLVLSKFLSLYFNKMWGGIEINSQHNLILYLRIINIFNITK